MSQCACIRGNFDFSLNYTHCGDIVYLDNSTWQEGYTGTPTYELTLVHPDGTETKYTVTKGIPLSITVDTCEAGIFEFKVQTCGEPFSKQFPILCALKCGWLKAIAKLGHGVEVDIVRSIRVRIEYVEAAVSFGDIQTAQALVESILRDLKRINCECACS